VNVSGVNTLRVLGVIALVSLIGWLGTSVLPNYIERVMIVMVINVILVASLGLSNGFTGVFSLGHPGFVALGAYVSGILTLAVDRKASYLPDLPGFLSGIALPFLPATLIAGIFCGLVAFVIGIPLMRLSGNYVSVATLGFLVIVNNVLINAEQFTRGSRTFTGIPDYTNLWWALGWASVTLFVLSRVAYSSLGRAMRASREDGIAAQAVGIRILPTRLLAFTVGAFFAGVGGALYGHYLVSFSPAIFFIAMMVAQLTMLVLGGQGSLTGMTLGVVIVTVLSEVLQNLQRGFKIGPVTIPELFGASQIVLGLIFILVMVFRPQGLMGDAEISLISRGSKARASSATREERV
jgi:branched-chain amino acid transport system permease protein